MITDPVQLAVDFFKIYVIFWAAFTFLEFFFPDNKNQKTVSRHTANEFLCGFLNQMIFGPLNIVFSLVLIVYVLEPFLPYHVFSDVLTASPDWIRFLAVCFIIDLAQYVRHRFTHAFIWSCHATHHAAVELRSSTHWRLHPVDYAVTNIFSTIFAFVLGFESEIIVWGQLFMLVNNMWIHVNMNIGYGWPLRYVFVSPNYHKWHHATDRAAQDKNFADLFVILDVLGRSYYFPRDRRPTAFGVMGVNVTDPLHQSYLGMMLYPFREAKKWLQTKNLKK